MDNSENMLKQAELARLKETPRYKPETIWLDGVRIKIVDGYSFYCMYWEIFERQIYRFKTTADTPYIIDGGANIGLSIRNFKDQYPKSRVLGFEPDERIFSVLKENIESWNYEDVELICRALWSSETDMNFWSEGSDGGRLCSERDLDSQIVKTARLRDYLDSRIDFLKLDIEGAETDVLLDCADMLTNVAHLFVEYHSFVDKPQTLHKLINIMADAGFRLHIHPQVISFHPFIQRDINNGMDLQLNIFGFRE